MGPETFRVSGGRALLIIFVGDQSAPSSHLFLSPTVAVSPRIAPSSVFTVPYLLPPISLPGPLDPSS